MLPGHNEEMGLSGTFKSPRLTAIPEDDHMFSAEIEDEAKLVRNDFEDLNINRGDNDFLDRSNNKCQEAKVGQAIDSTFFSSMRMSRKMREISSRDPLLSAIASQDEIDVQIILDELGPAASESISVRDQEGRTALHIAALSKSAKIISFVLNSYRRHEERQLTGELIKLAEEYSKTIAMMRDKSPANEANRKRLNTSLLSQLSSVKEWFDTEKARKMRLLEFRCEIWWAKSLCSRDLDGRTPLHYAVGNGADNEILDALIFSGRGDFFYDKADKKDRRTNQGVIADKHRKIVAKNVLKPIFDERSIYDLASGREMATRIQSPHALLSMRKLSNSAQPKSLRRKDFSQTSNISLVRNMSRILSDSFSTSGSQGQGTSNHKAVHSVDYDVVIPWILRNMLRSCIEMSEGKNFNEGLDLLEDSLLSADISRIGVFLVAELGIVLGGLGIRITTDILQELCRRYPGSMLDIREKWDWIESKKRAEDKNATSLNIDESYLDNMNMEEKNIISPKTSRRADSKNQSKEVSSSYSASSKHLQFERGDDYAEEKDSKSAAKRSFELTPDTTQIKFEKKIGSLFFSSLVLNKEDENLGLDIQQLIDSVRRNMNYQIGIDGNRALGTSIGLSSLVDINSTGDPSQLNGPWTGTGTGREPHKTAGSSTLRGTHFKAIASYESSSNAAAIDLSSMLLPSCLTLSTIMKARRNIMNVCDSRGRSPLLVASALGLKRAVSALLAVGADISLVTEDGHDAFTVAKTPIVRALPERKLLTWMNKREHSSLRLKGDGDTQLRGVQVREVDDLLLKTDELQRESHQLDNTLDGSSSENCRSKILQELGITTLKERQEGVAGNVSQSGWMGTDERARVVAALLGPLESLQGSSWAYSRPPLMWAVHNGLLSAVEDMLPSRSSPDVWSRPPAASNDPNCFDTVGRGPLHECAALVRSDRSVLIEGAVSIAEALIAAGARLNDTSVSGRTPLHELFCVNQDETVSSFRVSSEFTAAVCTTATHYPHPSLVSKSRRLLLRSLLHLGANPLLLDRHGMAPIHYCAREDYADCLLEILRAGYDGAFPNIFKQSPLHVACKAGSVRTAHLLCRWDADHVTSLRRPLSIVRQRDGQGKYPTQLLHHSDSPRCLDTLWGACRAGDPGRVSEIISRISRGERGIAMWTEVDSSNAAIHEAAMSMSIDMFKSGTLGADTLDVTDSAEGAANGRTRLAVSTGGKELWLVDGVDSKTRRLRWTALHSCVIGLGELRSQAQSLDRKNYRKHWNETDKHTANLRRKTDISRISQAAMSALRPFHSKKEADKRDFASKVGRGVAPKHSEVLTLLLKRHAYVDSLEIHCRTPLMLSAACNLSDICTILLDAGADVHATDLQTNTALHIAYAYGSIPCVMLLEAKGADPESRNGSGRTPIEEAGRAEFLYPLVSVVSPSAQ